MSGALAVLPVGVLYAVGVARAGGRRPRRCGLCGVAALALCAWALGPLDEQADHGLAAHMVQHLALGVAAPALLALSAPIRLAFAALPPRGRRLLAAALHRGGLRVVLQAPVAVALAAATMTAGHVPGVLEAVERHGTLHAAEHALLFWSALAAWSSLLGADPVPAPPGAVGLIAGAAAWMLPMAVVGAAYANADRVLVAAYAGGPAALADQRAAGTIMLLAGPALMAPPALVAAGRRLWAEEDRQRRRERTEVVR